MTSQPDPIAFASPVPVADIPVPNNYLLTVRVVDETLVSLLLISTLTESCAVSVIDKAQLATLEGWEEAIDDLLVRAEDPGPRYRASFAE